MLSVMVLLGVAFSISMRTERLAAGSYVDMVRARSLMDAALGRVVADHIPELVELYDEFYPSWRTDPEASAAQGTNFLAGKGISYVPNVLRVDARLADRYDWIDIRDPQTGTFFGQYAYLVINNSGLLDANIVMGVNTNRRYGLDPSEIRLSSQVLGEVRDPPAHLGRWRDDWFVRFESLPELYALGSWSAPAPVAIPPPFRTLPSSYVDHFHVFSYYPADSYVAPTGPPRTFPKAFIGGDPEDWDSDEVIIETLQRQPNPIFNSRAGAESFLNMLKDYAGEENPANPLDLYIPQNPAGLSFTRVPMINEVALSNTVLVTENAEGALTLQLDLHVFVETWFPFKYAPGIAQIPFEVALPSVSIGRLLPPDYAPLAAAFVLQGESSRPISPRHTTAADGEYRVTTFVFSASIPVAARPPGLLIEYLLDSPIEVRLDGRVVDVVAPNWRGEAFAIGASLNLPPGQTQPQHFGDVIAYSAFDPRLNWDPQGDLGFSVPGRQQDRDRQWGREPQTLGARNAATLNFQSDEFGVMYSAQRPLESVAELSYLLYSGNANTPFQPWKTMRLLGPDPDFSARLIDRFTLTRESYRRGLININSPYTNVIQAAFFEAPVESWRQAGGISRRATVAESGEVARRIVDAVRNSDGLRNLSAISTLSGVDTAAMASILGVSPPDKFLTESLVRNTLGVLGTRDTLYTVFLVTRTFPRGYDPDSSLSEIEVPQGLSIDDLVMAEQRAVALVWRDPALGPNDENRSFVRSFIWLTEED
jgi:hypothetical protein